MPAHTHASKKQIALIAATAAAVSAGVALLTTPKRGKELRGDIKQAVRNNKDRVLQTKHGIEEAKKEVADTPVTAPPKVPARRNGNGGTKAAPARASRSTTTSSANRTGTRSTGSNSRGSAIKPTDTSK